MKHVDAIHLRNKLQLVNDVNHFAINYAIKRSLDKLKTALNPLAAQEEEIKAIINDFEKERIELCELMATKDEIVQRNPDSSYAILPENQEEFEKRALELKEKHKEAIDLHNKRTADYQDFLNAEDSPFEPYTIAMSKIPENLSISKESMEAIFPLIDESK